MPAKPTPFSRPSIEIGAVKRVWKDVPAASVQVGDTVPDVGIVEDVLRGGPDKDTVVFRNVAHGRTSKPFDVTDAVRAFVYE